MGSLPFDRFTTFDQATRSATDCALAATGCGGLMRVDAPSQIKDAFDRCRDGSGEFESCHADWGREMGGIITTTLPEFVATKFDCEARASA